MSRVIFFLYTKTYQASNVPEVFRSLCSDPPELELRQISEEFQIDEEERELEESGRMDEDETTIIVEDGSAQDENGSTTSTTSSADGSASESEENTSDEEKRARMEKAARRLKVHAMVYKYADYLEIEDLAKIASDRFLKHAKRVCLLDGFVDPLATMYEHIPPADKGLRLRITTLMTENWEQLRGKRMVSRIMDHYTDGYWKVCTKLIDEQKSLHEVNLTSELERLITALGNNELRCKHRSKVAFRLLTPEEAALTHSTPSQRERWVFEFSCQNCSTQYPPR
jgi:hypothetical protein